MNMTMAKKTKEQLEIEVIELTDALKESDSDHKGAEKKVAELEVKVEKLENTISDLEDDIEQQPVFELLVDEMKHELFLDNYTKFTLEAFEKFIKIGDLY